MNKYAKFLLGGLLALSIICPGTVGATAPEKEGIEEAPAIEATITIIGVVNDNYQLITDEGEVYEIGIGEVGDELIHHPGTRAKVECKVSEEGDQNIILVISYQLIEE